MTSMGSMFQGASAFNQPLGRIARTEDVVAGQAGWNVSRVKDMAYMFAECSAFNEDLSGWQTGSVKDMSGSRRRRVRAKRLSICPLNPLTAHLYSNPPTACLRSFVASV